MVPTTIEGLEQVVVNGKVFCSEGSVRTVTRPAPVIFTDEHFREVNRLRTEMYYSASAALEDIADKYNFNHESFRRQYYARRGHKLKKWSDQ